jgi:hypothetical protein
VLLASLEGADIPQTPSHSRPHCLCVAGQRLSQQGGQLLPLRSRQASLRKQLRQGLQHWKRSWHGRWLFNLAETSQRNILYITPRFARQVAFMSLQAPPLCVVQLSAKPCTHPQVT